MNGAASGLGQLAGCRYWPSSLLPALVGTTLPFWLRPPGFSFRWLGATEFLLATLLVHAGLSLLLGYFEGRSAAGWPRSRLLGAASAALAGGSLLGLHLNRSVPGNVFLVFGLTTLFAGALYVAPPFRFHRRVGGEVVLAEGLGMLPVLGAYLVQTGDLTRTVYLASLPLVAATGLRVWMEELVTRDDDEASGRGTMVLLFGPRLSGRVVALALATMILATLVLAVVSSSLGPLALIALLSCPFGFSAAAVSWRSYAAPESMVHAGGHAARQHLALGLVLAASSLVALTG